MKGVGSGFKQNVGNATFGLSIAGIKTGGLNFEFLDGIGGRHVRRDHFIRVGGSRAGCAIDRDVHAVGARSVDRIPYDVRRLEGTIQRSGSVAPRGARSDTNQQEWIAMREGQIRYPARIDDLSQGG